MKASITDLDITLQPSNSLTKFFTIWVFGIPNHTFSAGTHSHKIIPIGREFTPSNCTFITKLSGQVNIFGIMLHSIIKNFLYFDLTHFIILFLLFLYSLLRILQRHLGNSKPSSIQRIIFHHQQRSIINTKTLQTSINVYKIRKNKSQDNSQKMEKLTKQLINQIIKNRKYNYSPEPLESFLQAHPAVRCNNFTVKNKHNETLSGMLLKQTYTDTCVLYAHGLGSNKLQALPAAEQILSWGMSVCAFDFAGSGRSEGEYTTYGVREQDDINAVLSWLDATRQFSKYILWGRSMGGTSILMSQTRITNEKVQCIVLDSPFSSFERVATEIASKSSIVPSVLISLMMDPLRKEFERHYPHLNPFNLDILSTVEKIDTKMIIMYSKNDRIVSYQHSKQISKRSRKNPIQIQIQEDHNKLRTKATYKQVRKYIDDCINQHNRRAKRSRSKGRGISVTSKDNQKVSKCRTSICSSAITEKSSNTELLSYPIFSTEIEGTPGSLKKPAIIKSLLMKNSHKTTKLFSFELTTNKQNSRGRINFPSEKRKQRPSILGCFQ